MAENAQILLVVEAEAYVEALEEINIKEIGSQRWSQQHEHLEKLNMQAAVSASAQEDEFVKEFLVTYDKFPTLVHELIATETWKCHVFPEMVEKQLEPKLMFPVYMVLYHEATVINLLETTLYHRDAMESASDAALDLLDYSYRKITAVVARMEQKDEDEDEELEDVSTQGGANVSSLQELQIQNKQLDFEVGLKAVSIIRYISDHLSSLPLSVTTRLLNTHDLPVLLVQLVENPPWTRTRKGQLQKFIDRKWEDVSNNDRFRLTKLEGQVWISLYQLLINPDCQQKYELNPYRKNTILKLRSYLNEILLDQMPVLGDMLRHLEQLAMMDPPPPKQELILEQVPEIRDKILQEYTGKWSKLAKQQLKTYFNPSKVDMQKQAQRLAEMYSIDALENLISEPPKCAVCGHPATKRCSRCQNEWYCRRECQVNHWKKHKKACDLLVESLKQVQDQSKAAAATR